jgi:type I restriction enzyme S subunit
MSFKEIPLDELVDFYVDNRGKSCPIVEKEEEFLPLIATNCITDRLYPEFLKVRSVNKDTYDNWFRSHPLPNDIIFVNKGTPGKIALVPEKVNFCIAQDMVALRIKPEFYTKYIFAVLKSSIVQKRIVNMQVGTLIPHFKKGDFKTLKLPIINDYKEQVKIGDLYFSLLEKIETNFNIIKSLEEISQTLFKRWFIDFNFPNEEGLPYNTSGGKMVESELGEIPEGWQLGTIGDMGSIIGGGTPSKKEKSYYTENGISWITPKDLSNDKSKFIYRGAIDITELGLAKGSAKLMPEGSVLFSSRAPIGYIAFAGKEVTTNQGFKSVVCDKGYSNYFIYFVLHQMLPTIEANAGGSTFKEISSQGLKSIAIVLPPVNLVREYTNVVKAFFEQIKSTEFENVKLINIRDSLLPKLLSDEIEIPDESVVG